MGSNLESSRDADLGRLGAGGDTTGGRIAQDPTQSYVGVRGGGAGAAPSQLPEDSVGSQERSGLAMRRAEGAKVHAHVNGA